MKRKIIISVIVLIILAVIFLLFKNSKKIEAKKIAKNYKLTGVIVYDDGKNIIFYNLENDKKKSCKMPEEMHHIEGISQNGKKAVILSNFRYYLYDFENQKLEEILNIDQYGSKSISPDGLYLFYLVKRESNIIIKVRNLKSNKIVFTRKIEGNDIIVNCCGWNMNNTKFYFEIKDNTTKIYLGNVKDNSASPIFTFKKDYYSPIVSGDGKKLIDCDDNSQTIRIVDSKNEVTIAYTYSAYATCSPKSDCIAVFQDKYFFCEKVKIYTMKGYFVKDIDVKTGDGFWIDSVP